MPRPIRKIEDLLKELEKYNKIIRVKVRNTHNGTLHSIRRVKRAGSSVQIWI